MNCDIYISASRRDYEVVSKIKNILHSARYTYFDDRQSFQPGSDFEQTIRAEIISSKIFLFILSENSSSSAYVREELRLALKEEKIVIPIVIDNSEPSNIKSFGHLLLEVPPIRLNMADIASAKTILLHEIEKKCGIKENKETVIQCENGIKNMQYDVFISCKSEDYPIAEDLYYYLKDNGFNVFLSSKELRKLKYTEYMDAISDALDSAYHLIVLGSSEKNIKSKWVKFEWTTFLNEQLSGRKLGQIMTFLDGKLTVADLPLQLRHFESFNLNNYRDTILHYVETPTYIKRKEEEKERIRIKIENEKIRKQKEAELFKERIRTEIKDKIAKYERNISVIEDLEQEILDLYQQIGKTQKECPICGQSLSMCDVYCNKCGWTFRPIFQSNAKISERHLLILRGIWNVVLKRDQEGKDLSIPVLSSQIESLKKENERLIYENEQYKLQLKKEKTSQEDSKQSKRKLKVYDIANIIIPCCSYKGSIFASDKLSEIGFQSNKCIKILNNLYNISISNHEMDICKTFEDLKVLIATKAVLRL